MNCMVCNAPPPSDACHITTKRLRGDALDNLMPLCRREHQEQHRIGIKSFVRKYNLPIDLSGIYAKLEFEWNL